MTIMLRRADPDDWRIYRELRLRALHEEPQAYASRLERELQLTDQQWRDRLGRAVTVLAFREEELAERSYRRYGFVPTGRSTPMERDRSIMESRFAYPLGGSVRNPMITSFGLCQRQRLW
jgi:hypothetical protein